MVAEALAKVGIIDVLSVRLTRLGVALEDFMVAVKPAGLLETMLRPTLFVSRVLMLPLAQLFGRVMATVRISLTLTRKLVPLLQVTTLVSSSMVQVAAAGEVGLNIRDGKINPKTKKRDLSVFFLTINLL